MRLDQIYQAAQQDGAVTDIIGERRDAQGHALGGIGLALPVQGLVKGKLVEQDHRQQVGTSGSARNGVEGRRRLRDRLARLADELLAHRLHHDPLAGDDLPALRDGLTDFLEVGTVTTWAGVWSRHDHAAAGEIRR